MSRGNVEMIHVSSSNVKSIGYDEVQKLLYVRFWSGALYVYKGVEKSKFIGLKTALSVGSYLNQNIKGRYPYERIE